MRVYTVKIQLYLVCFIVLLNTLQRLGAYPFVSTREAMEYRSSSLGGEMRKIGVDIFIGPSCLGFGKGLFLACAERNKPVQIPAGTIICKYAKGIFDMRIMGDKVIDYGMYNLEKRVMYEGQVLTLRDALMQNENALLGHFVQVDGTTSILKDVRPVIFFFLYFL